MPSKVRLSQRVTTRASLAARLGYKVGEKLPENRQGMIREDGVGCWAGVGDGNHLQLYRFVDEDMNDGQMDLVEIVP